MSAAYDAVEQNENKTALSEVGNFCKIRNWFKVKHY